jgi:hypothetical protein
MFGADGFEQPAEEFAESFRAIEASDVFAQMPVRSVKHTHGVEKASRGRKRKAAPESSAAVWKEGV